jgi:hypothetical protein
LGHIRPKIAAVLAAKDEPSRPVRGFKTVSDKIRANVLILPAKRGFIRQK